MTELEKRQLLDGKTLTAGRYEVTAIGGGVGGPPHTAKIVTTTDDARKVYYLRLFQLYAVDADLDGADARCALYIHTPEGKPVVDELEVDSDEEALRLQGILSTLVEAQLR